MTDALFKTAMKLKKVCLKDKPFIISFRVNSFYKSASIASAYAFFGATPTWRPTTSPF